MFTEQGIAMLSGVLRSDVAVQVSIKDARKMCFGISLLEDPAMVTELLNR